MLAEKSRLRPICVTDCSTYEDYANLSEGAPYQLIGGELVMTPAPSIAHQDVLRDLAFKLLSFLDRRMLGHMYFAPVDVYFNERDVFQPDILFISKDRESIIGKSRIDGVPDLVVEILSPSTAYYDLRKKYRVYEQSGVREYWIVDPEMKRVEVYENNDGTFVMLSDAEGHGSVFSRVLHGFKVDLADLFDCPAA